MCDEGPAGIDEIFILVFHDPMMPSTSLTPKIAENNYSFVSNLEPRTEF